MGSFLERHLGSNAEQAQEMLKFLNLKSLDELIAKTIPDTIRETVSFKKIGQGLTEEEALEKIHQYGKENKIFRSLIGQGYADCFTPPVILRNILENPGWYTQYTPYQSEISQGRLEALLNFQTMICDLTELPIANASLLDEATAAAEAMAMFFALKGRDTNQAFFVSEHCHPQTIEVIQTRAKPLGIKVIIGSHQMFDFSSAPVFGALLQYPATDGVATDYTAWIQNAHKAGALVCLACDLLALTLMKSPGAQGADVAVGSTQRFGVSLGYGGPHAAFFSTQDEHKRLIPGRIVGISKDVDGKPAIRLALQTREQHIRREKATSNICTAQVLLAIMASMYAIYHGPKGLRTIAERIHRLTAQLQDGLKRIGLKVSDGLFFDTIRIDFSSSKELEQVFKLATQSGYNFRKLLPEAASITLDELSTEKEIEKILKIISSGLGKDASGTTRGVTKNQNEKMSLGSLERTTAYLTHPVFNSHHSETKMLRYIFKLQSRDLSLAFSMIPLGSCTMKLNATAEMLPVTWPEFSKLHPFIPDDQALGYQKILKSLEEQLAELTGFDGVSLQPNAGSQGEYAGLLVIKAYQQTRAQSKDMRDICLIPKSAHGTNPASATMAGLHVVVVDCDSHGNIDLADLELKAKEYEKRLCALMVTYPSTHGVFEPEIKKVCEIVHRYGGLVYMDGANFNAQIGFCRPGDYGPDVCHLNLHKTFAIPHGGGGPGVGPICVKKHLVPFLPGESQGVGLISATKWGSAGVLPISWMYIQMMGSRGLMQATQYAILNANYIAERLKKHYPVLYRGVSGFVAHECIFDLRPVKEKTGIDVEDIAKRLMDYGFHAPTISFPVAGTLMVEPTESESKDELDRFCDAMISIREEIKEIEVGKMDRTNNPLKNAPHTAEQISKTEWSRPYTRERAVFPLSWVRENKFWPVVGRINNVLGDRQLICSCPPVEDYA